MEDILLLHSLKGLFLARIHQEWPQKFNTFGSSYDNVISKNAFLQALQEEIETKISHKIGLDLATEYMVSVDFLHRFLYEKPKRLQSKKRDTLSIYLDYDNWSHFVETQPKPALPNEILFEQIPIVSPSFSSKNRHKTKLVRLGGIALLVCLVGTTRWLLNTSTKNNYQSASFSVAKREGKAIPATLLFKYNLGNLRFDSAFIEIPGSIGTQTRFPVTQQTTGFVSATFMSSGIKNAYLEINGKRVKQLSFPIFTEGWGGRIITPNRWYPYQPQNKIEEAGTLYLSPKLLERPSEHQHFETHFSNCRDFGIAGDSSTLEVRVRNNGMEGGLGCHDIGWALLDSLGEGYEIHILEKSCTTFAQLRINNQIYLPSKHFDLLSKLGQNVSEWAVLKITLKNHQLNIFFNDKPILTIPYRGRIDKVKHISCKFMGSGRVDWVKLKNSHSGQVSYFEDFSKK